MSRPFETVDSGHIFSIPLNMQLSVGIKAMALNLEITWCCGVYIYLSSFQNRHTQHDAITCIWIFLKIKIV